MGQWVIHIEGTGVHHNFEHDDDGKITGRMLDYDADLLFKNIVDHLSHYHNITHATFTAGSTTKPEDVVT